MDFAAAPSDIEAMICCTKEKPSGLLTLADVIKDLKQRLSTKRRGHISGLLFLHEHGDLHVRTKLAYHARLQASIE